MAQGKTLIMALVILVIGFGAGFMLHPIIGPTPPPISNASAPIFPASVAPAEARGTQYFVAHIDEARRIVVGCRDSSVRGGECANAEEAITKVEASKRRRRFLGN